MIEHFHFHFSRKFLQCFFYMCILEQRNIEISTFERRNINLNDLFYLEKIYPETSRPPLSKDTDIP